MRVLYKSLGLRYNLEKSNTFVEKRRCSPIEPIWKRTFSFFVFRLIRLWLKIQGQKPTKWLPSSRYTCYKSTTQGWRSKHVTGIRLALDVKDADLGGRVHQAYADSDIWMPSAEGEFCC